MKIKFDYVTIEYDQGKMSKDAYAQLNKILDKVMIFEQMKDTDKMYVPLEEMKEDK